ncbi:lipopolysaccharide transport periplasmic protein LptA [Alloalcanivorax sp. C16-1]|uniref:lipopolysaccharide transport periplasmic protein LptA n=1 Tax=Alloalcanivorax sp. C16-1 TaxID=3390051 RepID=UPI0039706CED
MNSRAAIKGLGLFGLLFAGLAGAAQPPGGQPVEVSADSATFEQSAGTGVYRGDAELIQGNRRLNADVIRLFTENNQLVRVEATGNPVRMREGEDLQARARNLVYDLRARRLVLTGDAHVDHQGNTFEGARVQYNLDSRRVDASGEGDKRVRLVIPAKNTEPAGENGAQDGNTETP